MWFLACLPSGKEDAQKPTSILPWKPGVMLEFSLLVAPAWESCSHLAFRVSSSLVLCVCVCAASLLPAVSACGFWVPNMVLFGSCFPAAAQLDEIIELTVKKKATECGGGSLEYLRPLCGPLGLCVCARKRGTTILKRCLVKNFPSWCLLGCGEGCLRRDALVTWLSQVLVL